MSIRSNRVPRAIKAERGHDRNINAVLAERHRKELLEIAQVKRDGVATTSNELCGPGDKRKKRE